MFLTRSGPVNTFVDCTFHSAPRGFYQMMVVMIFSASHLTYVPIFYVLLQEKTEENATDENATPPNALEESAALEQSTLSISTTKSLGKRSAAVNQPRIPMSPIFESEYENDEQFPMEPITAAEYDSDCNSVSSTTSRSGRRIKMTKTMMNSGYSIYGKK
jgi:hypothetical protein